MYKSKKATFVNTSIKSATLGRLLGLALALTMIAPAPLLAWDTGTDYVSGTVAEVMVTAAGSVAVDFGDDGTNSNYYLCGISYQRNDVKMDSCKGWLKLLIAAQLSGKKVRVEYNGARGTSGKADMVRLYP